MSVDNTIEYKLGAPLAGAGAGAGQQELAVDPPHQYFGLVLAVLVTAAEPEVGGAVPVLAEHLLLVSHAAVDETAAQWHLLPGQPDILRTVN